MPLRSCRPARVPPRALSALALVSLVFLPTFALGGEGRSVPWRSDLAAAQAEARVRNMPIWLQFTGPWCVYCRKMDLLTFNDAAVASRAKARFIPVKLRSDAHEDLLAQFGITGLPATIILSPSGRAILARSDGYSDASEFAAKLDGAWANALADPDILAIGGYCPVRLVEGKGRVEGDARLAVFHDGHAYRFADRSARDAFLKDPETYLPSDGGKCVVTRKDGEKAASGDPRFGATYHGRLYLFASDKARSKFAADPDTYAGIDIADNGRCPHCKGSGVKEVAGKPEFATTHAGRRYLFPNDEHRQAFRTAPDRYLR